MLPCARFRFALGQVADVVAQAMRFIAALQLKFVEVVPTVKYDHNIWCLVQPGFDATSGLWISLWSNCVCNVHFY